MGKESISVIDTTPTKILLGKNQLWTEPDHDRFISPHKPQTEKCRRTVSPY